MKCRPGKVDFEQCVLDQSELPGTWIVGEWACVVVVQRDAFGNMVPDNERVPIACVGHGPGPVASRVWEGNTYYQVEVGGDYVLDVHMRMRGFPGLFGRKKGKIMLVLAKTETETDLVDARGAKRNGSRLEYRYEDASEPTLTHDEVAAAFRVCQNVEAGHSWHFGRVPTGETTEEEEPDETVSRFGRRRRQPVRLDPSHQPEIRKKVRREFVCVHACVRMFVSGCTCVCTVKPRQ